MLALMLIIAGAALRLAPHLPNVAPVAALALFGGVYLPRRYALLLPLGVLVLSDIFLGFDSWQSRLSVYGSFALVGLIGLWVRSRKSVATVVSGSLLGSLTFYLITNFAYLYPAGMYSHDLNGVLTSYYNALPFFRNTILGDLFYVGVLFGAYELALLLAKKRARSVFLAN